LFVVSKSELFVLDDIRDRANQHQAISEEIKKTDTDLAQREAMQSWNADIPITAISKTI